MLSEIAKNAFVSDLIKLSKEITPLGMWFPLFGWIGIRTGKMIIKFIKGTGKGGDLKNVTIHYTINNHFACGNCNRYGSRNQKRMRKRKR